MDIPCYAATGGTTSNTRTDFDDVRRLMGFSKSNNVMLHLLKSVLGSQLGSARFVDAQAFGRFFKDVAVTLFALSFTLEFRPSLAQTVSTAGKCATSKCCAL